MDAVTGIGKIRMGLEFIIHLSFIVIVIPLIIVSIRLVSTLHERTISSQTHIGDNSPPHRCSVYKAIFGTTRPNFDFCCN